jgi:hypothetical protein
MWRAAEKRNGWSLAIHVHCRLARTGGKPENKFKRRGAQLMSIQKKSLISTLQTAKKANVASTPTAPQHMAVKSMKAAKVLKAAKAFKAVKAFKAAKAVKTVKSVKAVKTAKHLR